MEYNLIIYCLYHLRVKATAIHPAPPTKPALQCKHLQYSCNLVKTVYFVFFTLICTFVTRQQTDC